MAKTEIKSVYKEIAVGAETSADARLIASAIDCNSESLDRLSDLFERVCMKDGFNGDGLVIHTTQS
jgi:hypothetical protein